MKLYRITYKALCNDSPRFTWLTLAENAQHAYEKFMDSDDTEWEVLCVVAA